jgi:hypothetical protein
MRVRMDTIGIQRIQSVVTLIPRYILAYTWRLGLLVHETARALLLAFSVLALTWSK